MDSWLYFDKQLCYNCYVNQKDIMSGSDIFIIYSTKIGSYTAKLFKII